MTFVIRQYKPQRSRPDPMKDTHYKLINKYIQMMAYNNGKTSLDKIDVSSGNRTHDPSVTCPIAIPLRHRDNPTGSGARERLRNGKKLEGENLGEVARVRVRLNSSVCGPWTADQLDLYNFIQLLTTYRGPTSFIY